MFVRRRTYEAALADVAAWKSYADRWEKVAGSAQGTIDTLSSEVAHLRAQNERLLESLTRMGRVERGMAEVPRTPRPAIQPAPPELLEYWISFADPRTGKRLRDEAFRAHAKGTPWATIREQQLPVEPPVEQEPNA